MELTFIHGMVLVLAPLFGIAYDQAVAWMERKKIEGETALWVVVGVAVTGLLCVPFIGWSNLGWMALMFTLTGVPMIVGSKVRYHQEQAKARAELVKVTDGYEEED